MTRRRGNGEDSVYKDGDRWRGAVSLGYDSNGRQVRKKVSGRTRAEAVEKLRKLRQQVDTGSLSPMACAVAKSSACTGRL